LFTQDHVSSKCIFLEWKCILILNSNLINKCLYFLNGNVLWSLIQTWCVTLKWVDSFHHKIISNYYDVDYNKYSFILQNHRKWITSLNFVAKFMKNTLHYGFATKNLMRSKQFVAKFMVRNGLRKLKEVTWEWKVTKKKNVIWMSTQCVGRFTWRFLCWMHKHVLLN
jgi:hypothetical protein